MDAEEQELRGRLREAARAHTPDRERMRARVERGMTGPSPTPPLGSRHRAPSWLRVAGATAAVAAVLAGGGYGVAAVMRADEPSRQRTVATPPEPERPDAGRTVWADGSIDPGSSAYWSQSNITLKARKPLTALTVELRLDARNSPKNTGTWRTLPADDFDVTVRGRGDGGLTYRWTLKPGRTVPTGQHVFAAQYDHAAGGRDAHGDTYTIRAKTGSEPALWKGDFA